MRTNAMSHFQPPWWLKNCHLQSCLGMLFRPRYQQNISWEELDTPDGDFIDLCWAGKPDRPIVILLHGLEGSFQSHYIQLMLNTLTQHDWQVVVMHFRTCSGRINRLARSYHASDTTDFEYLLQVLRQRYPHLPLHAIGFSLGGNVLLYHLAHHPDSPLGSSVAVSIPFEFDKTADYIPPFYKWTLLRSMKYKLIQKVLLGQPIPATIEEIKNVTDFRGLDNLITAPLNGFQSAKEYYERSSIRRLLRNIEHPTLIIHAKDDPFIPVCSIPHRVELSEAIRFELHERGGHVGFLHGPYPWRLERWFTNRILDFLQKSV